MIIGKLHERYEQLSFSGGGIRCFWQGGALDVLKHERPLEPERIAAASGGALAASCFISDCGDRLIDCFAEELQEQERNVVADPGASEISDITPHQQLYARVVRKVLDEQACGAVEEGPEFEVLLARPRQDLPLVLAAGMTLALYQLDKWVRSTPHGRLAEAAGTTELRIDARQAARDGRLCELVCLAATIPPVFDIDKWEGDKVIDAGTIDNAPMPDPNKGRTLVLPTRSYRNLPDMADRTYICPSKETPADKIDFTDAAALRATYEQGRRDMREMLADAAE